MAGDISYTLDTRVADRLLRNMPGEADRLTGKLAFDTQADMQLSYGSAGSPAPEGSPPGIVTGTLKGSIQVRHIRPLLWQIFGAAHGLYLEWGTARMGARPHIMPAFNKAKERAPLEFRGLFK